MQKTPALEMSASMHMKFLHVLTVLCSQLTSQLQIRKSGMSLQDQPFALHSVTSD